MQRPRVRTQARPAASDFPLRGCPRQVVQTPPATLSKPTARCGLSLPLSGCPFPGHLCGINVPGLHLRRTAGCAPTRPLPLSSVPLPGGWLAQGLVATHPVFLTVSRFSLPFRTFRSRRIIARCDSPLESLPSRNARFPFLPGTVDCTNRPDQRFGFAASRLARQLRKSLGTSIIVPSNRNSVNKEDRCVTTFSAAFLGCKISRLP